MLLLQIRHHSFPTMIANIHDMDLHTYLYEWITYNSKRPLLFQKYYTVLSVQVRVTRTIFGSANCRFHISIQVTDTHVPILIILRLHQFL